MTPSSVRNVWRAWQAAARGAVSGLALLQIVSCSWGPTPEPATLPPLDLEVGVEAFRGSPLTEGGATARRPRDAAVATAATDVVVQLIALDKFPWDALRPLTEEALLISAGEESPLLASSVLASGARLGRTDEALHFKEALVQRRWGPSVEAAALTGRLESGKTASFRFRQPSTQEREASRAFQVDVHRNALGSIVVALHVRYPLENFELPVPAVDDDEEESPGESLQIDAPSTTRETVLLRTSDSTENQPLVIAVPTPFSGHPSRAMIAFVEVAASPSPDSTSPTTSNDASAVATAPGVPNAGEGKETAGTALRGRGDADAAAAGEDHATAAVTQSLAALKARDTRRPALIYLATSSRAVLCEDLSLAASDDELEALASGIEQTLTATAPRDLSKVGWALERSVITTLAAANESNAVSLAVRGVLTRYAGQVGTDLALLAELAVQATDAGVWRERIEAENRIFLEDSSPAARQRAFDWLTERGKAPAGYFPLDAAKTRRAALTAR